MKCPVCQNIAIIKYYLDYEVYICPSCKLNFAPTAEFNINLSTKFDREAHINALYDLRTKNFRKIIETLKQYVPQNGLGLEVGSSYGWFLQMARDNGLQCIGIEPEQQMTSEYEAMGLKHINGLFPQDLPASINNLDFVVFNDVFEHIQDLEAVLNKCYEVLNDQGILVINLPLSSGPVYKMGQIGYLLGNKLLLNRLWQFNFYTPHFYYFNSYNLNKMLSNYRFKVLNYVSLYTFEAKSLSSRITMSKQHSQKGKLLFSCLGPLINSVRGDTGCFFAKKMR